MTDPELLSAAIQASGTSARAFARKVLVCNERSVYRWLKGTYNLPRLVREKCETIVAQSATASVD